MDTALMLLAQSSDTGSTVGTIVGAVIYLAIIVAICAGGWKMFEKAGQPGWGFIVPIYNLILLVKIAGRPLWMVLLYLIPIANIIFAIVIASDISKRFGRGIGTTIGLVLVPFIFIPILGFGSAEYTPPPAQAQ